MDECYTFDRSNSMPIHVLRLGTNPNEHEQTKVFEILFMGLPKHLSIFCISILKDLFISIFSSQTNRSECLRTVHVQTYRVYRDRCKYINKMLS